MKTYKQLRKYVVRHYGETVAKAMDKGRRKGGQTQELSGVLTVRVDWEKCGPFPRGFWVDTYHRLQKREAEKPKRKAPKHGRLDALMQLREEIRKRRGDEAAMVFDANCTAPARFYKFVSSLSFALASCLDWGATPMGAPFWARLYMELSAEGL